MKSAAERVAIAVMKNYEEFRDRGHSSNLGSLCRVAGWRFIVSKGWWRNPGKVIGGYVNVVG